MLIKQLMSLTMRYALLAWSRRAELSCDRAALLVTQDQDVVGRTMMKLAGGTFASKVDYDLFLEQGRDFQKNYDEKALDRFWADLIGPDEHLRQRLLDELLSLEGDWRRITVTREGTVIIQFANGMAKTITPPNRSK